MNGSEIGFYEDHYYNIMLVDDSEAHLVSIRRLIELKYPQFCIKTFESPKKCISYVKNRIKKGPYFGLAILDMYMTEMTGNDLSLILYDISPNTVTFLHTSRPDVTMKYLHSYKLDCVFQKGGTSVITSMMDQYIKYIDGNMDELQFAGNLKI